ncbi:hypothetical protein HYPSUDRAFT_65758 [Hypholoma sublateritium FD-334 SS-4]|uniref:Uncharacterized protein n=1 Tax=Hypholoma sublateritium (strain FD-334 SS-4) TaxID=945553 RepID=A0A0D2MKM1_HYPSF|nr:hypothetical protein HYPSUDRAFT_65758 [Hypholoma sublateritium FD-334 SS-4]
MAGQKDFSEGFTTPNPLDGFGDGGNTLTPGLPSSNIMDSVSTGRECSGFPTGFFRIRSEGTTKYWSLHYSDSSREGNALMLWKLVGEEDSQVHQFLQNQSLDITFSLTWLHQSILRKFKGRIMHRWLFR